MGSMTYTQKMKLVKTNGGYNIIAQGNEDCRNYLSVSGSCDSSSVDWWKKDDGNGRQVWQFLKKGGEKDKYVVKNKGRSCPDKWLGFKDGGDGAMTLFKGDDNPNVRVELIDYKAPEKITNIPELAKIISLGMGDDGRTELSLSKNCHCDQVLLTSEDNFSLNTKIGLNAVDIEQGIFNLVQRDRNCSNKFISVKEDCDSKAVDLWTKDDFSGR